jgi:Heavy metal binding domain
VVLAWALRLLLLAGAGGALAVALLGGAKPVQVGAVYSCPMHPAVRAPEPGACPICGMALVAAANGAEETAADSPALAPADLITVRPHVFPLPIRAPAWIAADGSVAALLYRDEAASLAPGAAAVFTAAPPLAAAVPVTLADDPARVWDGEMLELRFRATAATDAGAQIGWVAVNVPPKPVLTVDENVVFTAGEARYVLVANRDGGTFERRAVQIGRVINGRAVVVAGLAEGDRVVRRRAFFLDAESSVGASP